MKRMILVGMVAMGLAVRGAVGQELGRRMEAQNAQTLVKIAQDQMKQRTEPGTYLGIASSPVSAELREQLKLKRGVGLVVQRVEKDSPAEQAGVKQYDIIEKLDDQILLNSEQFAALVRMQEPGAQVKLSIIRQGQPQTLTATLVEKTVPVRVELFDPYSIGAVWNGPQPTLNWPGRGAVTVDQNHDNWWITSVVRDNILTLRREGDSMHLMAKDQAGNVLFDGDVNTEEDWAQVPPDVAAEARRLMARMKLPTLAPVAPRVNIAPATPAAPLSPPPALPR